MKTCEYCSKRATVNVKTVKCNEIGCAYWIHHKCAVKRAKIDIKNWICKRHKTMAIPRTPVSTIYKNNVNNDDEDERMSESDTYQNMNDSIIPRSTSVEVVNTVERNIAEDDPPETVPIANDSNPLHTNENDTVNEQIQFTPLFGVANKAKIFCDRCKKDASKHHFECKKCGINVHPVCLLDEEEESADPTIESFVCANCAFLLSRFNHKSQKSPKQGNQMPAMQSRHNFSNPYPTKSTSNGMSNKDPKSIPNQSRASMPGSSMLNMSTEMFLYKMQLRKLPDVVDADMSWSVFYSTFLETKDLFTDHENVTRIQSAIKDPTVKRIGGKGLFNQITYLKCIEDVNRRLKYNFNFLMSEAGALEQNGKIKPENKIKLVEFIDRCRNFVTISEAYNDSSYMTNRRFLANVAEALPNYLKSKWEAKQAEIEQEGRVPSLSHMVQVLDKELPRIEASIRNEKLRNADKKSDNKKENERKHRINNVVTAKTTSSFDSYKQSPSLNIAQNSQCWLHKTFDHVGNKCQLLWNLDGKVVSELAKCHNICTFCGQSQENEIHKPCKFNSKLECKMAGCNFKHHSLFCYKRKASGKQGGSSGNNGTKSYGKTQSKPKTQNNHSINNSTNEPKSANTHFQPTHESVTDIERLIESCNFNEFYTNLPMVNKNNKINALFPQNNTQDAELELRDTNLLGVLVVRAEKKVNLAFLIDSGSTVSLIEESVANHLQLPGPWCPLTLLWSGNHSRVDDKSRIVRMEVSKVNNQDRILNLYFRTVKNLNICKQKFDADAFVRLMPKFQHLELSSYDSICGVLGIDNPLVFRQTLAVHASPIAGSEYHGIKTCVGDYVYGTNKKLSCTFHEMNNKRLSVHNASVNGHIQISKNEYRELRLMELEIMGQEYQMPKDNDTIVADEQKVLDLLDAKVKKIDGRNRYIAPLLWTEEPIPFTTQESLKLAYKRFLIVEKQALKLGQHNECVAQVKNLLDKDYAVEVTPDEIHNVQHNVFYTPIFFIHPTGKRVRLIWDFSAKINGKSVNDFLLTGPNLYNNLTEILFKLREYPYIAKGDVAEMFHQIMIYEDDTHALRFIFRFSPEEKVRIFRMKVLPFGARCSPVISQYVKNKIAKDSENEYPQAAKVILKNSYVDDIVISSLNKSDLINLILETRKVLQRGGFNFLKINSNDGSVLIAVRDQLSPEDLSQEKLFSKEKQEKLLGYELNFDSDLISLAIDFPKMEDYKNDKSAYPTKRQLLKILMSIFDPLGLFQFVISKIKIIYHRACRDKLDWDEKLRGEDLQLWNKCVDWLREATQLKDPSVANSWRMATIIDTCVGSENQVRSVTLQIGKHKPMKLTSKKDRDYILKIYREEKASIITRPASAVAKISL